MILFHKGIIYGVMVDASLHNYYLAQKKGQHTWEN